MTLLRNAALVYGISVGALVAYNVRWRYLLASKKARKLPVTVKKGELPQDEREQVVIVLLHGMWHDAWYFEKLQAMLSNRGYTSYAVSLLPGERLLPGGSQRELVRDVEFTLQECGLNKFILLGHSQGGLLAQSAILNSPSIADKCMAAVLLGTYPLGLPWPMEKLLKQDQNMFNHWGYGYICAFGKLMNVAYTKHIFLMPTTDETTPAMQIYMDKMLKAPSDGLITTSHFINNLTKTPISTRIPALILGASHDVIYPPPLLKDEFDARFPHAETTHVVADNQAHCFVDPGWETSMGEPLLEWIDKIVAGKET